MEFEFDKEIDAILRRARRDDEVVTSTGAHLDADEISAFAENAVSQMARTRYTVHLADCARCRKILSNVITFNAEAETQTASSAVSAEIAEAKTPWYRRLFAFPQLAYAMGAMVLLFSGFFGYLILQNLSPAERAVSYSTNTATQTEPAAPRGPANTSANTNAAMNTSTTTTTNTSVLPSAPLSANTAPFSASNSNASSMKPAEQKSAEPEIVAPATEAQPVATPAPKPLAKDENADDDKNLSAARNETVRKQPSPAGAVREDNKRDKEEAFQVDGASGANTPAQKMKTNRAATEDAKKRAGETRSVGGKTFNNIGGIWFDSAVGKQ